MEYSLADFDYNRAYNEEAPSDVESTFVYCNSLFGLRSIPVNPVSSDYKKYDQNDGLILIESNQVITQLHSIS